MTDWDHRFLGLALHVATWSKDPTTQVGAVLVGRDKRDVAIGYNGFPPGLADTVERLTNRPIKHAYTQHAERNVLDNAHFRAEGATLFATKFPCVECAKSIISKRVSRVVAPPADTDGVWAESSRLAAAMFDEAGVEVTVRGDMARVPT